MQYFLKVQFQYSKNQYANLLLVIGIAGSLSQLVMMPILAPKLGEQKLLIIALLGGCVHVRTNIACFHTHVKCFLLIFCKNNLMSSCACCCRHSYIA
jgi:Na+/melibiose symporter-like transporter